MFFYITTLIFILLPHCYWTCLPWWPATDRKMVDEDLCDRKFVLILLDGFRWDYLNKPYLKGFKEIRNIGVQAEYAQPVFPSMSYPNYYTIATGLFVENHGITLNYMYNQETKETFNSNPIWWNQAEPLWITTTKAKMPTDLYLWPGCHVLIRDARPNYCLPYSLRVSTSGLENDLDQVVQKFARNETKIALVYSEQPDLFGHVFGPESLMVDVVVRRLDNIMLQFVQKLRSNGLENKVNVIIVSDHGMSPVDTWTSDTIAMTDYMELDDVEKILDRGAAIGIFPKEGKVDSVYFHLPPVVESLKSMPKSRVWKREDIPKQFHFTNNVNIPPVLLLADPGIFIKGVGDPDKSILSFGYIPTFIGDQAISGLHGYDPNQLNDMRGIFIAFGPDFKKGYVGPPVGNEDIYNLAMSIIGIPPKPNNGTWSSVIMYLANSSVWRANKTVHSAFTQN